MYHLYRKDSASLMRSKVNSGQMVLSQGLLVCPPGLTVQEASSWQELPRWPGSPICIFA